MSEQVLSQFAGPDQAPFWPNPDPDMAPFWPKSGQDSVNPRERSVSKYKVLQEFEGYHGYMEYIG